jgi:hypothetical protein
MAGEAAGGMDPTNCRFGQGTHTHRGTLRWHGLRATQEEAYNKCQNNPTTVYLKNSAEMSGLSTSCMSVT